MKPLSKLAPVPFDHVVLRDPFWAPRMDTNRRVTIPLEFNICRDTNRWRAFDPAWKPGDKAARHRFWDSDVAKLLEAAAYVTASTNDARVRRLLDEAVAQVLKAPQPDGYLNSYYTFAEPPARFKNLRDNHELYCAGHLMEAAVAHQYATGDTAFLAAMERYAALIAKTFGRKPGQKRGYCGHQEIELALVKLFRATGQRAWLDLAAYFIDERGRAPHYYDKEARERGDDPKKWFFKSYDYLQAHQPVREQKDAVGHAVRCLYMLCGMADVAAETGDRGLLAACERLWQSIATRRMLVTGGVGTNPRDEGFTFDYDLPDEWAYAETCAAIANVFFNHRMLQITGDAKYADVMERALYNGVPSGVSLDGRLFFYSNPLAVHEPQRTVTRGAKGEVWDGLTNHRKAWFGCACCPPNIARLYASLGGYVYSTAGRALYVHLYAAGESVAEFAGQRVRVTQETRYPWDGRIRITLRPARAVRGTVCLRMPAWCDDADLRVAGKDVNMQRDVRIAQGYVRITRLWQPGDVIEFNLAMPVQRVYAHPEARQLSGRVALQRGPIVYCLETCDNAANTLDRIALPRTAPLKAVFKPALLGGVTVIQGRGLLLGSSDASLYRTAPPRSTPVKFTAVPYCVWDNRQPGSMRVWLREIE